MLRLLPLLLLLPGAQDPADLIRKLEDDAFDVREQAQADLLKLGEAALPALRKALAESKDRAELRLRVQAALRDIELAVKSRQVCPEPRKLTLKFEGPLRAALAEIAKRMDVKIDASALDWDLKVAFDAQDEPLMKTLDSLGAALDARWEFVEDDRVRFLKEPRPAWPTSYSGAFRVRATSMRLSRSTDFKATTASLRLTLEADHEKRVKPSRGVDIEVTRAEDDKGSAIEARKGEDDDDAALMGRGIRINRGFVRMQVAGGGGLEGPGAGETLTLKGLSPAATRVSFHGTATFRFPLDRNEVRFAPPQAGETRDAGDLKLKLETLGAGRWKLSVNKAKPDASNALMEDVQQRLDLESLVGLDEEGLEHKGTFQPSGDTMAARIVVVNGVVQQQVDGVSYLLQFPTLRAKASKEIRFKFADRVLEKKVPFSFVDIPLP